MRNYLFIPPPPKGHITRLAKELGIRRQTVANALYKDTYSRLAEKVRFTYYEHYIQPYLNNNDHINLQNIQHGTE